MRSRRPHPFRDLRVYQDAVALVTAVYRATTPFPRREYYGLASQLRRAAVSIVANIAEGRSRFSPLQFAQFLDIAHGSAREVQALIEVCEQLGFIDAETRLALDDEASAVAAQLLALAHWARRQEKRA